MDHELFMIAAENGNFIVKGTCKYARVDDDSGAPRFTKCAYEVTIPKETAQDMSVDEMFHEAMGIFRSAKDDL